MSDYTAEDLAILARFGSRVMVELAGDHRDAEVMRRAGRLAAATANSRRRYLASIGMQGEQREDFWVESEGDSRT